MLARDTSHAISVESGSGRRPAMPSDKRLKVPAQCFPKQKLIVVGICLSGSPGICLHHHVRVVHLEHVHHAHLKVSASMMMMMMMMRGCYAVGLWNERREELQWPLGTIPDPPQPSLPAVSGTGPTAPADFVLEIGCEELPPEDVDGALQQLR